MPWARNRGPENHFRGTVKASPYQGILLYFPEFRPNSHSCAVLRTALLYRLICGTWYSYAVLKTFVSHWCCQGLELFTENLDLWCRANVLLEISPPGTGTQFTKALTYRRHSPVDCSTSTLVTEPRKDFGHGPCRVGSIFRRTKYRALRAYLRYFPGYCKQLQNLRFYQLVWPSNGCFSVSPCSVQCFELCHEKLRPCSLDKGQHVVLDRVPFGFLSSSDSRPVQQYCVV